MCRYFNAMMNGLPESSIAVGNISSFISMALRNYAMSVQA